MKKPLTQIEAIKKHLQAGKKLTPIQALEKFGCFRLAAVVFKLKNAHGLKIETKISEVKGVRFATYKLVK